MTGNRALHDRRALIAVDLGAESCRVSLLQRSNPDLVNPDFAEPHLGNPDLGNANLQVTLVHRFSNAPHDRDGHLYWDLQGLEAGIDVGLRRCADLAPEGICSIAVDGWAVDYVLLDDEGRALRDPFCYRDQRTLRSEESLHRRIAPERMRHLTGVQLLRINTLYQLYADAERAPENGHCWLNLPEYLLNRLGGDRVAERTNATHTQMVDLSSGQWCAEIFTAAQLDLSRAPMIVPPGTRVGKLTGKLTNLPAFRDTVLIAPACHDTASAIAGIPADGDDWAYISSGTWSLVGTLLDQPRNDAATAQENFTNLGAVGGRICFHKSVNGMWLLKQCMEAWTEAGRTWTVTDLIRAAELQPAPGVLLDGVLLDVDEPDLLLAGHMPQRINAQRVARGLAPLDESPENAAQFANLIFHSLASRYAEVLQRLEVHSGKRFKRLFLVGGGSRNEYLNRLTRDATGLDLICGSPESSTLGNFAVQLAALEGRSDPALGVESERVSEWAALLCHATREAIA